MQTYLNKRCVYEGCRTYAISPHELKCIFDGWMKTMQEQTRRRVVIERPREPPIKPAPVIRQPPQPPQRRVAIVPPKTRKPRAPKPLVITISILHEPDASGNDILFSRTGDVPDDVDPDALENYLAAFFSDDEYEEVYQDEDFEE